MKAKIFTINIINYNHIHTQPVGEQERWKKYDQKNGKGGADNDHVSDAHLGHNDDL